MSSSPLEKPSDISNRAVHDSLEESCEENHKTENSPVSEKNPASLESAEATVPRGMDTPTMGGGREYPPLLPNRDPYRVEFDGPNDPLHPLNWAFSKKLLMSFVLGYATFVTAWGSAIFASDIAEVAEHFHVGQVTATLGITFYVLGFASGPIVWSPLSETYGRKLPICISTFGLTVFSFGAATAKDFQTLMLCRFFGGFIGASPTTVAAAAYADMYNNKQRGTALIIFGITVFCGPIAAPVVGGFISASHLGWRWTEYITGIMAALAFVLNLIVYQESYAPIILIGKAEKIRRITGNWGVYAPHEEVELNFRELAKKTLIRPVVMLFSETILLLLSIYTAFIYGILYLFLEAYPIVFSEKYHFVGGVIELPYLGLVSGMIIAIFTGIYYFEPRYNTAVEANNGKPVPEARLPHMIVGSVLFPFGLFWFAWSCNYPQHVHWIVPTLSGLFTGYGLLVIFMCAINYIVDCYLMYAASAMAANTFLRSSFGAVFPLFAAAMFHNLGVNWAGTLIGCIAFLLMPVPFLFYKFGKRIRQRSKFAFDL